MALTVIPELAVFIAANLVSPTSPTFAATYADFWGRACRLARTEMKSGDGHAARLLESDHDPLSGAGSSQAAGWGAARTADRRLPLPDRDALPASRHPGSRWAEGVDTVAGERVTWLSAR